MSKDDSRVNSPDLLSQLRADVAAGAAHDCGEWRLDGTCQLCDRVLPPVMLYTVTIDTVCGERFYCAGGPDRDELLAFLKRYDHEGSTVTLDWCTQRDDGQTPAGVSADPERIYRILAGDEIVGSD